MSSAYLQMLIHPEIHLTAKDFDSPPEYNSYSNTQNPIVSNFVSSYKSLLSYCSTYTNVGDDKKILFKAYDELIKQRLNR